MFTTSFLILLSLHDIIETYEYQPLPDRSVFVTAQQECRGLGTGWDLPEGITLAKTLTDTMLMLNISSIWLALHRKTLPACQWVNGQKAKLPEPHDSDKGCAAVSLDYQMVSYHVCADETTGFVCEFKECPGNLPHSSRCYHIGGRYYSIECDAQNWYLARQKCEKYGGRLAILDNNWKIREIIKELPKHIHKLTCRFFYVGFHCEDWVLIRNGELEAVESDKWDINQPSSDSHEACVKLVLNNMEKGKWQTADCFTLRPVICQKYNNSNEFITSTDFSKSQICKNTSNTDVKCSSIDNSDCTPEPKVTITLAVFVPLACIIIISLSVYIVWRRRKKLQGFHERHRAAHEHTAIEMGLLTPVQTRPAV